ncbi:hypothetical protein CMI39_01440 [Candidatus Pacearchaeota archaeon]|nr:hypothetical protein [Candidatus Pacearchaeota archaeon]|tara:strand:+ start:3818 stop:4045 length:228 start_codon:yes stop_codon:yes gene_type:complete
MELKDTDNLEKALSENKEPQVSKEEEIGIHKGALSTLNNERAELFKMMQNVEVIMQAHIKRLGELGVKIETGQKK